MIRRDWRHSISRLSHSPERPGAGTRAGHDGPGPDDQAVRSALRVAYRELDQATVVDVDAGRADVLQRAGKTPRPAPVPQPGPWLTRQRAYLLTAVACAVIAAGAATATALFQAPGPGSAEVGIVTMTPRVTLLPAAGEEPAEPIGASPRVGVTTVWTVTGAPLFLSLQGPVAGEPPVYVLQPGLPVQVACPAGRPGEASAYYQIQSGPWQHLYVPVSDVFGGPPC
jgi:hypothetical protein